MEVLNKTAGDWTVDAIMLQLVMCETKNNEESMSVFECQMWRE